MEFFNDLSKRFSNVAKSVTEKTKDGVEVTRIASDLRIQKNALEQLYTELGKVCYAIRMGDGDAEQAEQLSARIQRTRARIDELTAQRDAIRDVRRCASCGAVMSKDARFCSSCGKRLPEDPPRWNPTAPPTWITAPTAAPSAAPASASAPSADAPLRLLLPRRPQWTPSPPRPRPSTPRSPKLTRMTARNKPFR